MPTYHFEGMDASGSEVKDRINATNEADAQRQLRAHGYFVTRLQKVVNGPVESTAEVGHHEVVSQDDSRRPAIETSRGGRNEAPPWMLPVASSVFLIGGLFFLVYLGVRPQWLVWRASDWVETPCTVISSKLKIDDGSEQTVGQSSGPPTYSVEIVYKYEVGGREYQADRYDFVNLFTTDMAKWEGIVKAHPPGKQTVCFVNPTNPAEVVLKREWTSEMAIGWWFPIPFVLFGVFGLLIYKRTRLSMH